jgi:hypothetical protein
LSVFISSAGSFGQVINNEANASLLANRAKSLLKGKDESKETQKSQRLQRMGSQAASVAPDAECGGVAIGNVRPVIGDHRAHKQTIIILGHVINTGNRC